MQCDNETDQFKNLNNVSRLYIIIDSNTYI